MILERQGQRSQGPARSTALTQSTPALEVATKRATQQSPSQVDWFDLIISTDFEIEPKCQVQRIHRAQRDDHATASDIRTARTFLFVSHDPRHLGKVRSAQATGHTPVVSEQGRRTTAAAACGSRRSLGNTRVAEHRSGARLIFFYHPPSLFKRNLLIIWRNLN